MNEKIPGLNGLRGIAASWILIGHTYQISGIMSARSNEQIFREVFLGGPDMVNLFFVISGFIITYLLANEKTETGRINLRHFYFKRFLRIWPLYFLVILIVFLLGNFSSLYAPFGTLDLNSLAVLILFLVTLNGFWNVSLSVVPHYWSLSVEEQFYLFWPVLLRKFEIIKACITVIIIVFLARNGIAFFSGRFEDSSTLAGLNSFLVASKFSSMAIGGIGAWLFRKKHPLLKILSKPTTKYIVWTAFFLSFFMKYYVPYIHSELQAIFYLMVILSVVRSTSSLFDNKLADLTGRVSYGIYMYHWPLIPLLIFALQKLGLEHWFLKWQGLPLILLCFSATFGLAILSYYFFEVHFLRLKRLVSGLKSRPYPAKTALS